MNITLDKLMEMEPQRISSNKDLIKEFAEVRKKLLKKGFNTLTFEDSKDRSSRLWFEDRRIVSYNAKEDKARIRFNDAYELDIRSEFLNINRLVVIKSIAEYLLKIGG